MTGRGLAVIWGSGGVLTEGKRQVSSREGNVPYLDWVGSFMCLLVLLLYGSFMQTN